MNQIKRQYNLIQNTISYNEPCANINQPNILLPLIIYNCISHKFVDEY